MSKALKAFMKENFDFSSLKKVGFYPKDMKHTDYEGQAKRVCHFFGYESVYEYKSHEIRCHISYAGERPPSVVDNQGKLKLDSFVTVVHENPMHI
jgi:hypothetical protein